MLQQTADTIQKLNNALNGSIDFYSAAASMATADINQATFHRIAVARKAILTYLRSDDPEKRFENYSFGSAMHKVYSDMFVGLLVKADPLLVREAKAHEAQLHHDLEDVLEHIHSPELVTLLLDVFPQLNGRHTQFFLEDTG